MPADVASRNVLIPTYTGHLAPVTNLAASIREHCGNSVGIVLVIGAKERPAFEPLVRDYACRLLYIEDLLFTYANVRADADRLLTSIDRFRYQSLKKLLGIASLSGNVLVMDSESVVTRDLGPLFDGGIENTTVIFSERPWPVLVSELTRLVHAECCELLREQQPYWFFESFNWLYSSDLVRDLLQQLLTSHGKEWMFRRKALFECQLYFQYAFARKARYRFAAAHEILALHFGPERAAALIRVVCTSPLDGFGMFEYLARFVSREEYIGFVSDPRIVPHFRLMRHEPYAFFDVVGTVRAAAASDPNYFGEASMHRGALVNGRIAVIVSGRFHHEEDAHNVRHFLRGVECDVFLGLGAEAWPEAIAAEILQPRRIARVDEASMLEQRRTLLQIASGVPEKRLKADRDLGSMAMFDKMAAGWSAMVEEEKARGKRYSVVVRMRPDIFCSRGLRDILWEVCEHLGALKDVLLAPDRFWSQGINDQLFLGLRDEMGRLFEGLDAAAYAQSEFLNPEYFLGTRVLAAGLKPIAFPFEYILTRGAQPELRDVQHRMNLQERLFWSSRIGAPPWKDARAFLAEALSNVRLKNGRMEPLLLPTSRGVEVDLLFARDEGGRRCMMVSEHKSPALFLFWLSRGFGAFAPHAIAAGVLRPERGTPVQLESFDQATGRIALTFRGAGPDSRQTLQLTPPPTFLLVRLAHRSFSSARDVYKGARSRAGRFRRQIRASREERALPKY